MKKNYSNRSHYAILSENCISFFDIVCFEIKKIISLFINAMDFY